MSQRSAPAVPAIELVTLRGLEPRLFGREPNFLPLEDSAMVDPFGLEPKIPACRAGVMPFHHEPVAGLTGIEPASCTRQAHRFCRCVQSRTGRATTHTTPLPMEGCRESNPNLPVLGGPGGIRTH